MPDVVPLRPVQRTPDDPAVADPIGSVRGLLYESHGKQLIRGIDFDIPRSSRTVIMGPNGAGKSLLLRLLHGLLVPTGGEVRWNGRVFDATVRREQAMVFQRPVLLRRSVAANLRFVLKQRGQVVDGEIERLLDEVGLADRSRQPARLLSGGEQQRLTLARALATRPRVLFLDEPTASLDPAATAAIEAIVQRAHERGTKIIFVTHNVGQARRLADDVVFMHEGRLAERSSADAFFEQPTSQAAIDYLEGRLVLR